MISMLAKAFIKTEDQKEVRKRYGMLCSIVGIFLNVLLFVGKYFAGMISGSIAITADAFNNLSDAGSSAVTLIGFQLAGKKPDLDHPFGHGRFEYISGLIVSMAILIMGFELGRDSLDKIRHPQSIDTSFLAMGILVCSILVKMYMAFYNRKVGDKIDSSAMRSTSTDSLSDCIATTVVLISMLIMKYAHHNVDGISGLFVAAFILYAGYSATKETVSPLLGQAPEKEFVEEIRKIVMAHPEINGIHDLMVHDYGPGRCMISLHAEVSGEEDIYQIHDAIDNIEKELNQKLGCESVIHMDPIETNNQVVNAMKKVVCNEIEQINPKLSIHDFRMVQGETHTNLIFDVVLPVGFTESDEQVRMQIVTRLKKLSEKYNPVITVDHTYI